MRTYDEVRRYASRIRQRTGIRDRMGAMPPWYVEKDIGIQHYKNDNSLSDLDLAKIQAWVDNGAPEGDPAAMPDLWSGVTAAGRSARTWSCGPKTSRLQATRRTGGARFRACRRASKRTGTCARCRSVR